jgi:hypothetical protein
MGAALSPEDLDTARHHLGRGARPSTVAGWFGTSVARLLAAVQVPASVAAPPAPGPREPVGCRWIDGDVRSGAWGYCQAPQRPGSSYCGHHHGVAWVPPVGAAAVRRARETERLARAFRPKESP